MQGRPGQGDDAFCVIGNVGEAETCCFLTAVDASKCLYGLRPGSRWGSLHRFPDPHSSGALGEANGERNELGRGKGTVGKEGKIRRRKVRSREKGEVEIGGVFNTPLDSGDRRPG